MGVHIGDDPVFIFPSFIGATFDEIFDRAKEKFYEAKSEMLSRMPAGVSESKKIFNQSAEKTIAAGSFLLYRVLFHRTGFHRSFFLDVKKAG